MKKFKFLSAIALSVMFVSCDGYDLPDPKGESYPEPDGIFQDADLATVQGDADINLQQANNENVSLVVAKVSELKNFPDTYSLAFEFEVSGTPDFAKSAVVPATLEGDDITLTSDAFNGVIREGITKAPYQLDVYGRLLAYAVNGTTRLRLGGNDVYYGSYEYDVKPFDPAKVIEEEYYLVSNATGWNLSQAVKMTRTDATAISAYDNPNFQVKIDVDADQAAAGYQWKVVPASAITSGLWDDAIGVTDATATSGDLVVAAGQTDAGLITAPSPYLISIDVEAMTYEVSLAIEQLWVPSNGTSPSNFAKILTLQTDNYINYRGVSPLRGNNWFTTEPNFTTSIQYYGNPNVATVAKDGTQSGGLVIYSKDAAATDQVRITLDRDEFGTANALYWIDVNLIDMTYSFTRLNTLSLVGGFNGWNEKEAPVLTPSNDFLKWTGTFDLDGSEFKINANHAWDIDFGGVSNASIDGTAEIVYKGSNMTAPAGKYDVTVNFSTVPYVIELVRK